MAKVIEVTVGAGRTFNHPHESYSNLRPSVTFRAVLEDGEEPAAVARELQAQAESLVEDHKHNMLRSLEELYQLSTRQAEVIGIHRQLKAAQERLEDIRKDYPEPAMQEKLGLTGGSE